MIFEEGIVSAWDQHMKKHSKLKQIMIKYTENQFMSESLK